MFLTYSFLIDWLTGDTYISCCITFCSPTVHKERINCTHYLVLTVTMRMQNVGTGWADERAWGEHKENLRQAKQCIKIPTWNSWVWSLPVINISYTELSIIPEYEDETIFKKSSDLCRISLKKAINSHQNCTFEMSIYINSDHDKLIQSFSAVMLWDTLIRYNYQSAITATSRGLHFCLNAILNTVVLKPIF